MVMQPLLKGKLPSPIAITNSSVPLENDIHHHSRYANRPSGLRFLSLRLANPGTDQWCEPVEWLANRARDNINPR